MSGFISLLRSVKDEWWWKDSDNIKQWLTLVMMAVYEDKQYVYNNKTVFLKRGQLVTSIRHLASLYGCSKSKTKNFLDLLELMNNIRAEYTRDYTVITILDYDRYQLLMAAGGYRAGRGYGTGVTRGREVVGRSVGTA